MATKKVLVEINVEQKGNSIPKTTKEVDKLAAATKRLAHEQSDEAKEIAKVNYQIKAQREANKLLAKEQVNLAESVENTNGKMNQFKTTSGLTGAIVTEFGRTASDSAYGIRGMGNNISQIVTLFGQLQTNVKKAGGTMKDSFAQIFQSMKGIIGVMTALQIVLGVLQAEWFQKWASGLLKTIGLMDLFKGRLDVLNDVFDEASTIAGESVYNFKRYTNVLKDSTSSAEQKRIALEKLNDEFPDYNTNLIIAEGNTKRTTEANDDYIESLIRKSKAIAAESKLNEIQSSKFKFIFESDKKILEAKEDYENDFYVKRLKKLQEVADKRAEFEKLGGQAAIDAAKEYGESNKLFEKFRNRQGEALLSGQINQSRSRAGEAKKKLSQELKDISKELEEDLKQFEPDETILEKYLGNLDGSKAPNGNPISRAVKRFKEARFSLESELQKSENELKKTTFRTNKEIIQDEGESSKDVIKIKTDEFKKRERLRLKNFIAQKEIDKKRKGITQAEKDRIDKSIEEAEAISARTIELADKEANGVIESITKVTDARTLNRQRLDDLNQRRRNDSVEEGELGLIANLMSEGMQKILAEEELAQIRYDNKVARANEELALDTLTEDKRRDLETQKSLWSQQKAQEDLDFDVAMIEERFRVQQEYIGFISQTSGVLQAIGNKNKEWQKTQLILEKGAAIAGVVTQAAKSIATQTASQGAATGLETATAAALNSISFGAAGTAYLASKKSDISSETAKGIAKTKVSAGLSIAAITAGAVSGLNSISNSGGGSSGGGGSTTVQPPDFNIVGSTGVNQLADAIGSTEKQPVKAFVVASDVTTQQALDRNNRSNAEL